MTMLSSVDVMPAGQREIQQQPTADGVGGEQAVRQAALRSRQSAETRTATPGSGPRRRSPVNGSASQRRAHRIGAVGRHEAPHTRTPMNPRRSALRSVGGATKIVREQRDQQGPADEAGPRPASILRLVA